MVKILKIILVGLLLVSANSAQAGQKVYPKNEKALTKAIENLNWETEPKKYSLATSHGEYQLPEGLLILREEDARQMLFLNNGTEFPDAEALVFDPVTMHQLIFSYFKTGYVRDENWSDLDADLLLEGIIESTEENNIKRIKNGLSELIIMGWTQKPTYEISSRTAFWSIKAKDGANTIINAIAIKLGRRGFSKLTWVGPHEKFNPSKNLLREALNNYKFEKGFRYADYSTGDKIATIGLASLVAVTAGSKGGKGVVAGLLAMLLIFAKKLWILLLLPFIFVWGWIKRLFTSKKKS